MTYRILDPELVRRLLRYEPDTGKLFWLPRCESLFAETARRSAAASCSMWNGKHAWKEAFTSTQGDGYFCGGLFGKLYLAHRVAWCVFYGIWPSSQIDHKNRNRADNRITNLREATRADNARNTTSAKGSSSKYLGVSWHKQTQKWQASIWTGNRKKHLGLFDCEDMAAKAYDMAAIDLSPDFASLNLSKQLASLS